MKLRLDLLKYLTDEDIMEEALANTHRYKPEPLFAKTGKGYLRPTTPEEKEEEMRRSAAFIARIKARAEAGQKQEPPTSTV
jgi:hypothetical protein